MMRPNHLRVASGKNGRRRLDRAPLGLARARDRLPRFGRIHQDRTTSAEADHRIANHLALLAGYLRLKASNLAGNPAELNDESVQLLLADIGIQIDAVARLHRSLVTEETSGLTDIGAHLHRICAPFAAGLSGAIKIIEDIPAGFVVRPDQVLPLTQIVTEVITNAVKYSHPAGEAGTIHVSCRSGDGGGLLVEIADDGHGMPDTFYPETGGGLGLRLLRSLSKQIGAFVTFESSNQGVRFRLALAPVSS